MYGIYDADSKEIVDFMGNYTYVKAWFDSRDRATEVCCRMNASSNGNHHYKVGSAMEIAMLINGEEVI